MQAATTETPHGQNRLPFRRTDAGMRARSIDPRLVSVAALLLVLVLWELAADARVADPFFISSPSRIAAVGWQLAGEPDFWRDVDVSTSEFVTGYAAAIAIGIPLGFATAWYRRLNYLVGPFIDVLNVVPRISFLPIIIIWFGIGIWSKVAVVLMGAVIPIAISTHIGAKSNEARFLDVARSFDASRLKVLTSIVLPGTVPFIFTGLKYGAGRALLGVVVGELYAATAGIGHMIAEAGNTFETDTLMFGVLLFTASGLAVTGILNRLERHFERWRPEPGDRS